MDNDGLDRFIVAQDSSYEEALTEIKNGRKQSHWMWFIFPQIKGLGYSPTSLNFAIEDMDEATNYLHHPILGERLITISKALLKHSSKPATQIFGTPDDLKLRSAMTLFAAVDNADPVFQQVLDQYFHGEKDNLTLSLLGG